MYRLFQPAGEDEPNCSEVKVSPSMYFCKLPTEEQTNNTWIIWNDNNNNKTAAQRWKSAPASPRRMLLRLSFRRSMQLGRIPIYNISNKETKEANINVFLFTDTNWPMSGKAVDLVSMKVSCVFLLTTVTPTFLTSPYSLLPILTLLENIDSGGNIESLTTACLFFDCWQVSHVTLVMWIVYPMQLVNVDRPVFIKRMKWTHIYLFLKIPILDGCILGL